MKKDYTAFPTSFELFDLLTLRISKRMPLIIVCGQQQNIQTISDNLH